MRVSVAETVAVSADGLKELVESLFARVGLASEAASRVAEALVDADLEGTPSHGVMLVEMYIDRLRAGSVSTQVGPTIVSDRGVAIVLDAQHALGVLSSDEAMQMAITRAKKLGAGVVAVRNGFHFGAARRYALAAAAAQCVGIAMCNTRPLMPAPGGAERVVGNNPIAIAVPTDGPEPLVVDMATSEAAMGRIRMAAKAGQSIPSTWAVRDDGLPTTDPTEAIAGMLLPSAGHKGFGLAFFIDLLCGLLSGGGFGDGVRPLYGDPAERYDCSHLFIAINAAHFTEPDVARAKATKAATRVRDGRRAPGVERLFTPGEPEWSRRNAAQGIVHLEKAIADSLISQAQKLGMSSETLNRVFTSGAA